MATSTDDFFRSRLDQMIDLRHPFGGAGQSHALARNRSLAGPPLCPRRCAQARQIEDIGPVWRDQSSPPVLASPMPVVPACPPRLMVSLLYLKHAFNESDEDLVPALGRDTHLAILFGQLAYFEHRWPCDPTLLVKFRKLHWRRRRGRTLGPHH